MPHHPPLTALVLGPSAACAGPAAAAALARMRAGGVDVQVVDAQGDEPTAAAAGLVERRPGQAALVVGGGGQPTLLWARLAAAAATGWPAIGVMGVRCPLCAEGGECEPPLPPPPPPRHLRAGLAAAGGRALVAACLCGVEAAVARSHATAGGSPLIGVATGPAREAAWLGAGLLPRVPQAAAGEAAVRRPRWRWPRPRGPPPPPHPQLVFERVGLRAAYRAPATPAADLMEATATWPRPPALAGLVHKVSDAAGGERGGGCAGGGGGSGGGGGGELPPWIPRAPASALAAAAAADGAALIAPFSAAALAADRWAAAAAVEAALGGGRQQRRWPWPRRAPSLRGVPSVRLAGGATIDAAWLATVDAVVVKPRAAAGVPGAHALAVARLPPPAGPDGGRRRAAALAAAVDAVRSRCDCAGGDVLVQPYIDHGGAVIKVYCAAADDADDADDADAGVGGGRPARRPPRVAIAATAVPSGPDLGGVAEPCLVALDSRAPDAGWAALRRAAGAGAGSPPGPSRPPPALPPSTLAAGAAALAAATGLVLFGFDVVVDVASGLPYVVDVNYLPSLAGLGRGEVWAAIEAAAGPRHTV